VTHWLYLLILKTVQSIIDTLLTIACLYL